ncbi:MAG: helix-turn-helix domain-containing protein [Rhodobacterales bacterium]|nr:MAG: helix-turn-helix domain-containing protein [Rhodobacterales bacterium]
MIGWGFKPKGDAQADGADAVGGFDTFEMRLGDLMRGERATLGKSLLDVQRELKIKAAYIAAIENADPEAFDTPGFIAGYVRSYARYLNMDPDWTFQAFCRESGFATAHGMSEAASSRSKVKSETDFDGSDPFSRPVTPFTPETDPFFASVEPRAIGSIAVLAMLIAGLGYGAWTVLQEVQRVQFAPLDQTPVVASNIDPLAGGSAPRSIAVDSIAMPSAEAFDRLYRPEALDVPVLVARDAPISTLDPHGGGTLESSELPEETLIATNDGSELLPGATPTEPSLVQVTETPEPGVTLLAVRPVWVRVRAADGSVIFEKVLDAGEEYAVPASEEPPTLRAGNSGSLFFKVAGQVYGPAGPGTSTAKNVALGADVLKGDYQLADLQSDNALSEYVTVAEIQPR